MQIVLTHVQRLVLRRLARVDYALSFVQIVPNQTAAVRRQYRVALDFLVSIDFVSAHVQSNGTEKYLIAPLGRRELYPQSSFWKAYDESKRDDESK